MCTGTSGSILDHKCRPSFACWNLLVQRWWASRLCTCGEGGAKLATRCTTDTTALLQTERPRSSRTCRSAGFPGKVRCVPPNSPKSVRMAQSQASTWTLQRQYCAYMQVLQTERLRSSRTHLGSRAACRFFPIISYKSVRMAQSQASTCTLHRQHCAYMQALLLETRTLARWAFDMFADFCC